MLSYYFCNRTRKSCHNFIISLQRRTSLATVKFHLVLFINTIGILQNQLYVRKKCDYFIDLSIIGALLTNEIDERVVVLVLE